MSGPRRSPRAPGPSVEVAARQPLAAARSGAAKRAGGPPRGARPGRPRRPGSRGRVGGSDARQRAGGRPSEMSLCRSITPACRSERRAIDARKACRCPLRGTLAARLSILGSQAARSARPPAWRRLAAGLSPVPPGDAPPRETARQDLRILRPVVVAADVPACASPRTVSRINRAPAARSWRPAAGGPKRISTRSHNGSRRGCGGPSLKRMGLPDPAGARRSSRAGSGQPIPERWSGPEMNLRQRPASSTSCGLKPSSRPPLSSAPKTRRPESSPRTAAPAPRPISSIRRPSRDVHRRGVETCPSRRTSQEQDSECGAAPSRGAHQCRDSSERRPAASGHNPGGCGAHHKGPGVARWASLTTIVPDRSTPPKASVNPA